MSTQVERVNAIWDRIEKWFAENRPSEELPAGAAPADIVSLETHLGRAIPEELKTSLLRHNGLENISKGQLLTAEEIKEEWNTWAGVEDLDELESLNEPNEYIQSCFFDKAWIPIDADGGGNGHLIDLNPGPKGTVGQVVFLCHETGGEGPVYPDYATYLESVAKELEAGGEEDAE